MKITQMLEREDFYAINQKTLDAFFGDEGENSTLYIYPQLNAIIPKKPSKRVKQYLLCEYAVRGNVAKRMAVRGYVRLCLASRGRMSGARCIVRKGVSPDMLIYPCNKKHRIFDFGNNSVSVVIKDGFPTGDLENEIAFRTREDLPDFVPRLLSHSEGGYTEAIIDGVPLARVSEGFEEKKKEAYSMLREWSADHDREVDGTEYARTLAERILSYPREKILSKERLSSVTNALAAIAEEQERLMLSFSHGDLQAGNIWIENGSGKIYIIDWESFAERSVYYDEETLFGGLRPGDIAAYLQKKEKTARTATVLLEDILFRLGDLYGLPSDFGSAAFDTYLASIDAFLSDTNPYNEV